MYGVHMATCPACTVHMACALYSRVNADSAVMSGATCGTRDETCENAAYVTHDGLHIIRTMQNHHEGRGQDRPD